MSRLPMSAVIVAALTLTLLLSSCKQTAGETTNLQNQAGDVQKRIQNVENRLLPLSADHSIEWGNLSTLAERMERYGVPGVGIAVINNYQFEWAQGYGVLEVGRNLPVTAESLFNAGSISKPVAATLALILVDRSLLNLDQDVNDRMSSWHVPENEYTVKEKVTLRRLLSHSSDLTDGYPMRSSSDPEYEWYAPKGEAPTLTIQQLLEAQTPADEGHPTRVTQIVIFTSCMAAEPGDPPACCGCIQKRGRELLS
jgi:CubicO group peptidase (beta-lactamase class C family)